MTYEEQYLSYLDKILTIGKWVYNERTGEKCLTMIDHSFEYSPDEAPLLTVKQSFPVSAVAEFIGYLRGYTDAQMFADIGCQTWFANANENEAWLANPYRSRENDMGKVYGAIGRDFGGQDLLINAYNDLRKGTDNRGEILTFWKPDDFDKGCLRPCMYSHHFSILDGELFLTSYQRSLDAALGGNFNSIQCYFFLNLMARVTGLKAGKVYHKVVNNHIYESHIDGVKEMLSRTPLEPTGKIELQSWVTDIWDVIGKFDCLTHAREYITVSDYEHLGKIDFKMAV